jgi:flavodoxin
MGKKLTAYFSHSGNTREIASYIHKSTGGDIFEIRSVEPYPVNYDAVVKKAKQEQEMGHKPALKAGVGDIGAYDVIFVGYPNWWGTIPMPVVTFLSGLDLSGKSIVPFCTHEGSRFGRSTIDIAKLCPRSKVLEGIEVRGSNAGKAQEDITAWLRKIGMMS